MGQFHISAAPRSAVPLTWGTSAVKTATPETQPRATLLERMSPRHTGHTLGNDQVQLEVGYQSPGPEILTRATDPTLAETLQAGARSTAHPLADKTLMAGTVLRPDEHVQIRLGVASAIDTQQLEGKAAAQLPAAASAGLYAGVEVKTGGVASRIQVETLGEHPRIGAGVALTPAQGLTVAVSYQHPGSENQPQSLRIGAELAGSQNTVLGVNVSQPIQPHAGQDGAGTAVGMYLQGKF